MTILAQTLTSTDWVIASAASLCGIGLALWVTTAWRSSLSVGMAEHIGVFKKLVLFLLYGTIPSAFQGVAIHAQAGALTLGMYIGGLGAGWIVGWFFTQGTGSIRGSREQAIEPEAKETLDSSLQVYALAVTENIPKAIELTGLTDQEFTRLFEDGTEKARPYIHEASEYERNIFLSLFSGHSLTKISRDHRKTAFEIATDFTTIMNRGA